MSVFYVTGCKSQQEEELVPMNVNDVNHNPRNFIPHRQFYSLPSLRHPSKFKTNHAPKQRALTSYKRKKRLCNQFRIVVFFLVFFVLLSVVMTTLFLWQVYKGHTATEKPKGCIGLPKPVPLAKLPESLKEKLRSMEEFIAKQMSANKDFGALSANLVYRDQVVWRGTFGAMSKSDKRKPDTTTLYPCASISKVFTALVAYKLFDERKIRSLDDPVTLYDPDFRIKNPFNNHNITLRNLLSMTSGMPREAPCYPPKLNNLCPYDHNTMLKRIQNVTLLVEPNTIPQYSNFGVSLLGNVLAKRFAGGDYIKLIKKYVLDPLKMDNTKFSLKKSQPADVPVVYDKGKPVGVFDWGWLDPAGGMFTTVDDLAKMEIEIMTDRSKNRFLSKYATKEFLSNEQILTDTRTMVGASWEMKIVDGFIVREKGGRVFGYDGWIAMVPELRTAFNVLCTHCDGFIHHLIGTHSSVGTSFAKDIVPSLENELRKHEKQNIILPPNYEAYIGKYTTKDFPFAPPFTITKKDDKLLLLAPSPMFYLNYTAPRLFRFVINKLTLSCRDVYVLSNENDPVVFDDISSRDGLSHGFTLYGANPSGRAYFSRLPSS